jgi:hypothetical protein
LRAELDAGAATAGWASPVTSAGAGADADTTTGACGAATGGVVVTAASCAWIADDSP